LPTNIQFEAEKMIGTPERGMDFSRQREED